MKIQGILNSEISKVLSDLRHTDTICISDCGLPVPDGVKCIDLALKFGVPSFLDVLDEVLNDMKIEKFVVAEEITTNNSEMEKAMDSRMELAARNFGKEIAKEKLSHVDFKKTTAACKVIIRTGENTPYANIILQSDCIFQIQEVLSTYMIDNQGLDEQKQNYVYN